MELDRVDIATPVEKIVVRIHYYTERNSTAIEWLLLEILKKTSQNPLYKEVPLNYILKGVFFIDNGEQLVKPCVMNLLSLGAITLETNSVNTAWNELTCGQIKLTDIGRELQGKGVIPGVDNDKTQTIFYDSLYDIVFVDEKNNNVVEKTELPTFSDITPDDYIFPQEKIKEYIESAKGKNQAQFGWLSAGTHLGKLEADEITGMWRINHITFSVDDDMAVHFTGRLPIPSNEVLNYLPDVSETQFLGRNIADFPIISLPNLSEVKEIIKLDTVFDYFKQYFNKNSLLLVSNEFFHQYETIEAQQNNDLSNPKNSTKEKKRQTNIVLLSNSAEQNQIFVDANTIQCTLKYDLPIEMLAMTSNEQLKVENLRLYSDMTVDERVYCLAMNNDKNNFLDCLTDIIDTNVQSNPECLVLYLAAEKEDIFNQKYPLLLKKMTDVEVRAAIYNKLSGKYKTYTGKKLQDEVVKNELFVTDELKRYKDISLEQLLIKLKQYEDISIYSKNAELFTDLLKGYIVKLQAVKSLTDTNMFFQWLAKQKASIQNVILKTDLYKVFYTDNVIQELLNRFDESNFLSTPNYSPVDKIFHKIKRLEIQIQDHVHPLEWSTEVSDNRIVTCILQQRNQVKELLDNLTAWNEVFNKLKEEYPQILQWIKPESDLAKSIEIISHIQQVVAIFDNTARYNYPKVYIADTCSLINHPEIISAFDDNKALLVVPIQVIEELDKQKQFAKDRTVTYGAREAIRLLNTYQDEDWLDRQEEGNLDMMPEELRNKSGDNRILSVGVKFFTKKPIIISDDSNLRNKATSLKMQAEDSKSFLAKKSSNKPSKKKNKKGRK